MMADEEWIQQHHQHQQLELFQQQQGRTEPPKDEPYFALSTETYSKTIEITIFLNPPNGHETGSTERLYTMHLWEPQIITTYFGLHELQLMEKSLELTYNQFMEDRCPQESWCRMELHIKYCDTLEFEIWRTLVRIIKRGFPNLNENIPNTRNHLDVTINPKVPADARGLDQKLALVANELLNLHQLHVKERGSDPHFVIRLPTFYESIRQLQSLEYISLDMEPGSNGSPFFLSSNCLYNIADSIESLPNLKNFHFGNNNIFILPDEPEIEDAWEALFCAAGNHRAGLRLLVNKWGWQYTGDNPADLDQFTRDQRMQDGAHYRIPEHYWNTLRNGPTVDQVLTQLKRQRRLPEGFPQNNQFDGNLEIWVQALIVVKDIQLKGKDRWDVFHFLFSQLVPTMMTYNNMNQKYLDTSDPNVRVPWLDSDGNVKSKYYRRYW